VTGHSGSTLKSVTFERRRHGMRAHRLDDLRGYGHAAALLMQCDPSA
jgi:hypothetical protein